MGQDIKIVSVSIPVDLVRELDAVCDAEHRNRSELYREALRQYLKLRRWQALREYGSAKASDAGGRNIDIESLIEEFPG